MNVLWGVCSGLPPVLSKSLNTPVMKVPNTSYFNIINLGMVNIILIVVLHCMTQLMLLLTQCRKFSEKLTMITMNSKLNLFNKLKLNLFNKFDDENKHMVVTAISILGCVLLTYLVAYYLLLLCAMVFIGV